MGLTRLIPLATALCGACGASAATTTEPALGNGVPGNAESSASGVRGVDWQNMTYYHSHADLERYEDGFRFDVVEGKAESFGTILTVGAPVFGDATRDGIEDAVLLVTDDNGNPNPDFRIAETLYVFTYRDGKSLLLDRVPVQEFVEVRTADDGNGLMIVSEVDGTVLEQHYEWNGSGFVESTSEE